MLATAAAAPPDVDAKDPGWQEFSVLKAGKAAGEFGFKTVMSASGKIYTSSKLEMLSGKKVTLQIQTHVERDADGTLAKYKKWIGKQQGSADTDLIAFWPHEKKLRVVSKNPSKYKVDLHPPKPFYLLDAMGFHLYAEFAGLWKAKGAGQYDCLVLDDGTVEKVGLADAGTVTLKRGDETITVKGVKLSRGDDAVTLFVGEKTPFVGCLSKDYLVLMHGFSYVSADPEGKVEPEKKPEPEAKPEAEEKPEHVPLPE